MEFEFAVTDAPVASPGISVRSIYHVMADPSYDVDFSGRRTTGLIAVRTLRGSGGVTTRGKSETTVAGGTLLIVGAADILRYRCVGDSWEFWWFEFNMIADSSAVIATPTAIAEQPGEHAQMREAVALLSSRNPAVRAEASAALARLYTLWQTATARDDGVPARLVAALDPALSHIRENYAAPVRIQDLARMCNYSVRRFQDLFRLSTGMTPSEYLAGIRLEAAREYLVNTNLPLRDIAERVGYGNEYYFSRCFKGSCGLPPGTYRRAATTSQTAPHGTRHASR